MLSRRSPAFVLALLLAAAGCASGGGTAVAPAAAVSSAAQNVAPQSSAAQHILANVGSASGRAPQSFGQGDGDADDGGRGELVLPVLQDCGNGTFATNCSVWAWSQFPIGPRGAARTTSSVSVTGTPPVLNFCRDGASMPADLDPGPVAALGPTTFALSYTGTHSLPIVTFATRWWNVSVTNTFAPTSQVTPNLTVTPLLTNGASRGWLVFFTWSWPADVLLVPYAINEIQIDRGSVPLAIPRNGSASLYAFDCLSRPITATRFGSGFGFGNGGRAAFTQSSGPVLHTTVTGTKADGFMLLIDDRGANAVDPVTTASAAPSPTPSPTATPIVR